MVQLIMKKLIQNNYGKAKIKRGEDVLFNVLDVDGNTPKELTACWRVWSVFKNEIEIIYET